MLHQYWVTKKTVLKKLGEKEDECVVSSDAELDAKLELFRSISDSCLHLKRILDQYQQRLNFLADEEISLGKFLRDAGKSSDPAGKHMASAGKAISYCGQQRLLIRSPLIRLYHEVETFRGRAIRDMLATVTEMEKARIEYRAALSWMKSTSSQLDPDTGRGLDSFRKAQRQVRESKKIFDKLTLDVLQKIDLLAAARCNMFSHVLGSYQSSFLNFSSKVEQTYIATATTMDARPHYEFNILKELSQNLEEKEEKCYSIAPQDKDQMLFFQDEYKDEKPSIELESEMKSEEINKQGTCQSESLIDTGCASDVPSSSCEPNSDLVGLNLNLSTDMPTSNSFMPSQLLEELNLTTAQGNPLAPPSNYDRLNLETTSPNKTPPKKGDKAAWFKLFAELDPLANPDNLLGFNNQSHTA